MTNKITNCRLLIADYLDELQFKLDIYTEELLAKVKETELLIVGKKKEQLQQDTQILEAENTQNNDRLICYTPIEDSSSDRISSPDQCFCSNKMSVTDAMTTKVEFINWTRRNMIKELKSLQEQTLAYYNSNSSLFEVELASGSSEQTEKLRSRLFGNKFAFFVLVKKNEDRQIMPDFELFLFVVDFYLNPDEVQNLNK